MGKFASAVDNADPTGWVRRELRELRKEIREMRAEKRLATSTVGEGGSLQVVGELAVVGEIDLTGDLSMKSGDGAEMIRMGDTAYGRGLEFMRSNGVAAFLLRKAFSTSTRETWSLLDAGGVSVVEENALGAGLGRPFLELPFQPYAATSGTAVTCGPYGFERTTSSTSWETLFAYDGKAQNYLIDFKFAAMCSDATTAAEIQVVNLDDGTPRPGYLLSSWLGAVPAGTTTMTVLDPSPDKVISRVSTVGAGGYQRLGVQVRVTAGTGTVTLAIPQAMGG